ncbi:MAG: ABC transporter permease [Pseudomonadota bacterium]
MIKIPTLTITPDETEDFEANHSILSPERDLSGRHQGPLLWVVAVMCFLASLTLAAMLGVNEATERWQRGLSGSVTVQIKPQPGIDPQNQIKAAEALLAAFPGVLNVAALDRAETESLLEPWLGVGNVLSDLPVPNLIEVKIDTRSPPNLKLLAERLPASVPGAVLDDHSRWNDRLLDFAGTLQVMTFAILSLVTFATVTIVIFATRAGLSANNDIVEVLHLIGARDRFIADEFQRHFLWMGLKAGALGAIACVLILLMIARLTGSTWGAAESDILPSLALSPGLYFSLILVPVGASLVAMMTARLTVLRIIARIL